MNIYSIKLNFILLVLNLFLYLNATAEVITDGSMGAQINIAGKDFLIDESLGSRKGDNLFHSFKDFNINSGESATFTGDKAIKNVINRVTGGNLSTINGLLRSEIGSQGFYFINPAGVVFGANAQVDVPASFYISTAKNLIFDDGYQFNNDTANKSNLSIASPKAFGFGAGQSGKITINQSNITLNPQATLSLSATDIKLTGNADNKVDLIAPQGEIEIIAQANKADYTGKLEIIDAALDVQGNGSGTITLKSANLSLINSQVKLNNSGDKNAKQLGLQIKTDNFVMDNSQIYANTIATGNGANISIETSALFNLINKSEILTNNSIDSSASNSNLTIYAGDLFITGDSQIKSSTFSTYAAGNISITAKTITLDGYTEENASKPGALIRSESLTKAQSSLDGLIVSRATGNAGSISINAQSLNLFRTGVISTSTYALGNAGNISLNVAELNIDSMNYLGKLYHPDSNELIPLPTGIFSNSLIFKAFNLIDGSSSKTITNPATGTSITIPVPIIVDVSLPAKGNAGTININSSKALHILNGGQISSSTSSDGNAGVINVQAKDMTIEHFSPASNPNVDVAKTGIFSSSLLDSTGQAGTIDLNTDSIDIINSGQISTNTSSNGNAGQINIVSKQLFLSNQGNLSSSSQGSGNAGQIDIATEQLKINSEALIGTSSSEAGNAGKVTINADDILINGAEISSSTAKQGQGGEIFIQANNLFGDNAAYISSTSRGSGNAGFINLKINNVQLSNNSAIFNNTSSSGNAGVINVQSDQINLANFSQLSSNSTGSGNAGQIHLISKSLQLNQSARISTSSSKQGNAGNIDITTDDLEMQSYSAIDSITLANGNSGNIQIKANDMLMNKSLISVKGSDQLASNSEQTPSINLATNNLTLYNLSNISAQTSGSANAANITVTAINNLDLYDLSRINSDAERANAGAIVLSGNKLLLHDGLITTSVGRDKDPASVIFGNGGNITINNKNLYLINGFIQANTQGRKGIGGNIIINSKPTIASYKLEVAGGAPKEFTVNSGLNIIQAAAPEGAPGNITIRSPIRDISSEIAIIKTEFQGFQKIESNPCKLDTDDKPSSLIILGNKAPSLNFNQGIIPSPIKIKSLIKHPLSLNNSDWLYQKPSFITDNQECYANL